ncbi:FkbM family methyltransferase [Ruminiclostridium herbifermentans]|uniref:FkbM family methyltransferase n=1 Tax=Ruminiclostridium herbifermentans TaxID=2488810 RepID=A0A4U7J8W0_9FIRM|nr:FkbM family methyltransferase [Ruminiclostridium herbifermentans]QNU66874.1 FkbM family methyltransferase [Ruminiclostridium herbifermentans]
MVKHIFDMCNVEEAEKYNDIISSLQGRNVVLYGAGGIGFITSNILKDKACNICNFIDDDKAKQGTYVNGIKVVALEDVCVEDAIILICLPNPMEVYNRLIGLGYKSVKYYPIMMSEKGFYDVSLLIENQNKIESVFNLLADDLSKLVLSNILKHRATMDFTYLNSIVSQNQYFPNDIFILNDKECFVDGGAYNGETIAAFIDETNNKFRYIYAFEPDLLNYNKIKETTKNIDSNILKLFNAGLYSKTGEIGFNSNGNSASSICETGKDIISLIKLDEVVGDNKPTYIKLDIEGAEEEALYGMRDTISRYCPKLAISIYHKAADLWELPLLILKLFPSYKIYMRHYSNGLHETVCYAI